MFCEKALLVSSVGSVVSNVPLGAYIFSYLFYPDESNLIKKKSIATQWHYTFTLHTLVCHWANPNTWGQEQVIFFCYVTWFLLGELRLVFGVCHLTLFINVVWWASLTALLPNHEIISNNGYLALKHTGNVFWHPQKPALLLRVTLGHL